jgi:hypothetical protein
VFGGRLGAEGSVAQFGVDDGGYDHGCAVGLRPGEVGDDRWRAVWREVVVSGNLSVSGQYPHRATAQNRIESIRCRRKSDTKQPPDRSRAEICRGVFLASTGDCWSWVAD